MKTKRIVSLFLAVILILSCSVTVFAKGYFYKDFENIDEMNSFFEKYSADFPDVEYSDNGIHASSKYFTLKHKEFLQVDINDPEYIRTTIHCSEVVYERGVDSIFFDYEHTNGFYEADISISYDLPQNWVDANLENMGDYGWDEMYAGEVMGYPYVAGETCDEFGLDEECLYKIAVGDVLVMVGTNAFYDKNFIEKLVIEKTGITLPVYEQVEQKSIEVSEELLSAIRVRHNKDFEKSDIDITDLDVISDTKQFVRYFAGDGSYSCDVVYQYIGDYGFCTPQRPLPQVLFDGALYELEDAYDTGIITDDDLAKISTFESRHYSLIHKNEFMGDISGDFEVNVYDATIIQRCLAGLSDVSWHRGEAFADFDEDGTLSVLDATGIQMKLAKLI